LVERSGKLRVVRAQPAKVGIVAGIAAVIGIALDRPRKLAQALCWLVQQCVEAGQAVECIGMIRCKLKHLAIVAQCCFVVTTLIVGVGDSTVEVVNWFSGVEFDGPAAIAQFQVVATKFAIGGGPVLVSEVAVGVEFDGTGCVGHRLRIVAKMKVVGSTVDVSSGVVWLATD